MTAGQNVIALLTAHHEKDLRAFVAVLDGMNDDELRAAITFLMGQLYAVYETSFWAGLNHDSVTALIRKIGARIASD